MAITLRAQTQVTIAEAPSKACNRAWITFKVDFIDAMHLSYLESLGMGFDAIWISPIVENLEGSYHGYHATNIYKINPHFGTEQDLHDLIEECHRRDIWVMLDVVANHVGPVEQNYSQVYPFNSSEHYHDLCYIYDSDWGNQWKVENCRLANLPDLKQEHPFVTQTLYDWVKDIVQKYNFDGLRVDTVPEVPKEFWDGFQKAAGVYAMGEVFNGDPIYVSGYQGHLDATLNYPGYFALRNVFQGPNSMWNLATYMSDLYKYFPDPTVLGIFVDNHDNGRFLNVNYNLKRYKNALAYVLTSVGIPIIYYGTEQQFSGGRDPGCREALWGYMDTQSELYVFIKNLVAARKTIGWWKEDQVQRYQDDNFYAMTRGLTFIALTNADWEVSRQINDHPYNLGDRLCNLLNSDDCVTVDGSGFNVHIADGLPKIYVVANTVEAFLAQNLP